MRLDSDHFKTYKILTQKATLWASRENDPTKTIQIPKLLTVRVLALLKIRVRTKFSVTKPGNSTHQSPDPSLITVLELN